MREYTLTAELIMAYGEHLKNQEHCAGTVEKYLRDARAFVRWLGDRKITEESAAAWKEHLQNLNYAPTTINSMLAALNGLFRFLGWDDCRVRFLKVQRRLFRESNKELSREEYSLLLATARSMGRERLELLMETICATGIRVSEVQFITVEAIQRGRAEVALKGKIRTILIPNKLARKLIKYARKQKIVSGEIFLTRNGKGVSRRQIWAEMKALCKKAGVAPTKVFPHNLRHLFATVFYKVSKDLIKLADILGHSSVETTRIYLLTSGQEHQQQMERLGLVL